MTERDSKYEYSKTALEEGRFLLEGDRSPESIVNRAPMFSLGESGAPDYDFFAKRSSKS
jgi:hypothetical protein